MRKKDLSSRRMFYLMHVAGCGKKGGGGVRSNRGERKIRMKWWRPSDHKGRKKKGGETQNTKLPSEGKRRSPSLITETAAEKGKKKRLSAEEPSPSTPFLC